MATPPPGAPHASLDFGRSFTFVSEDPDWIKKVLIGGAFVLACLACWSGIPFVLGYFSRTLTQRSRRRRARLPEWDDLGGIFERRPAPHRGVSGLPLGVARHRALPRGRSWSSSPVFVGRPRTPPRRRTRSRACGALVIVALYGLIMLVSLAIGALPAGGARAQRAAWARSARRLRVARERRIHQGEPRRTTRSRW